MEQGQDISHSRGFCIRPDWYLHSNSMPRNRLFRCRLNRTDPYLLDGFVSLVTYFDSGGTRAPHRAPQIGSSNVGSVQSAL